jgi:hypothetical protein
VLLQLAAQSQGAERERWLKMAIESHYSASVVSPADDPSAHHRLEQLPAQIAQSFPGSPASVFAALQEVRADHLRVLAKSADQPAQAQDHLRRRLLNFAQAHARSDEAPRAVMEAGKISEAMNRTEDAVRCYRYLAQAFPGHPLARKAEGIAWRLGGRGQAVDLKLPLLFPVDGKAATTFDLAGLHGKHLVVYFWASTCKEVEEDFQALKVVTDRCQDRGLEVVYVNLDADAGVARAFLAGRLTAGTHVHQAGGMESVVAQRYGLQSLPQAMLVGPDGNLLKPSLQASQVEGEVNGLLPPAPRWKRRW